MTVRLTRWRSHTQGGVNYSIDHLHPFDYIVALEATAKYPAQDVRVHVGFSSHCFTRTPYPGDLPEHRYSPLKTEDRTFCPHRHGLSPYLPDIVRGLPSRNCFYAGKDNYFVVELPEALPQGQEYWVFFDVRHIGQRDGVLLFVQSAYPTEARTAPHGRRRKKVGFRVLLNLALQNRRPQPPP